MPAAIVVRANRAGLQAHLAEQRVHDGRLPDVALDPDERDRAFGSTERRERAQSVRRERAQRDDRRVAGDAARGDGERLRVLDEVDLRQRERDRHAARRCCDQASLDAPQVEAAVDGDHDEQSVDACRDRLQRPVVAGGAAREEVIPREDAPDRSGQRVARFERDVVADDGKRKVSPAPSRRILPSSSARRSPDAQDTARDLAG